MENFSGLKAILKDIERGGCEVHIPVPLTAVNVTCRLVNFTAEVRVSQTYVNKEATDIECVYCFPVEEEAAVVEFAATLDGREIKSQVKKKEEAKEDYDKAVGQGVAAFLLEETGRPDIFQIKVGRLAPGSTATVLLTYIVEVPLDETGSRVRLTIPTTIAPKYVPLTDNSAAAKRIASIPYDFKTPAPLGFQLMAEMSSRILSVTSPSHADLLETTGLDQAAVGGVFAATSKFASRTTADLDRDIVFLIETAEVNEARVVLEQSPNSSVLQLSYVPRFSFKPQGTELIFLVDCSGSMHGEGIQLAGEALTLFLASLPVDAFFNIVCFGSTYRSLFPESRRYDDDTLGRAKQLAAGLAADLGGTEIYQPLEAIVTAAAPAGAENSPRQIFVLTDGQVSNTAACIKLVGEHCDKNRVFTLGIGAAADRHLVKGLARAGGGAALFTTAGESLAPKVLKQLKNAVQPCVTDFNIEWGTERTLAVAQTCQAPGRLPPIYNGTRLQVFRLLDNKTAPIPSLIKLSAKVGTTAFTQEITVSPSSGSSQLLHKMFARKMIQDLEENYEAKENKEELKGLITELGLKFGLATSQTSFVAVDSAAPGKEIPATMVSREVANQVAHGFGGFGGGGMMMSSPPMAMMSMCGGGPPPPMRMARCYMAPMPMAQGFGAPAMITDAGRNRVQSRKAKSFAPLNQECRVATTLECDSVAMDADEEEDGGNDISVVDAAPALSPKDHVLRLASLQSAQGSFSTNAFIAEAWSSGCDKSQSLAELEAAKPPAEVDSVAWMTALVVVLLEEKYSELRDYWELLVDKARTWLSAKTGTNLDQLLSAARQLISS